MHDHDWSMLHDVGWSWCSSILITFFGSIDISICPKAGYFKNDFALFKVSTLVSKSFSKCYDLSFPKRVSNVFSRHFRISNCVFAKLCFMKHPCSGTKHTWIYMKHPFLSVHEKWTFFFRNSWGISWVQNSCAGSPALRNQWSAETLLSAVNAMDGDAQLGVLEKLGDLLPDSPSQLQELVQAWYHYIKIWW